MQNNRFQEKVLPVILPILMGFLGVGAMIISTNQGPGIAGDATIYIKSAENLLKGEGLGLVGPQGEFRLLPYFPPFFSLVLSFLGLIGIDLAAGAHWLNMLLFGGLIWLIGALSFRITRSWIFSLLLMFLVLASPVLIPIYSWAMSEPLSFFLGFGGLALAFMALEQDRKGIAFYSSAAATGLAFLTRYSAVAYIAAGILAWLFLRKTVWKHKLFDGLIYGIIAVFPMGIWVIYDLSQTTTVASRSIENAAEMVWRFGNLWPSLEEVMLFWVIPNSWVFFPDYDKIWNHLLFFLLAGIVIGWTVVVVKKLVHRLPDSFYRDHYRFGLILLLFSLAYLAVIAVVYIFTFPPITIYHRMISPVHIAVLWMIVLLTSATFQLMPENRKWINFLTYGFVFLVFWYGWRTTRIVQQNYEVGFGYTAPEWRQSETIDAVEALPEGSLMITNEQNAILFLTDRPAYPLKEIYRVEPLSVFFSFGQGNIDSDENQKLFREGAALVLFNSIHRQMTDLYGDLADERVAALTRGLYKAYEGNDGAIYYYNEQLAKKYGEFVTSPE